MPRVLFPTLAAFGLVGGHLRRELGWFAGGTASVVSARFRITIQQTTIPDELRGRVASFNIFVFPAAHDRTIFEGGAVASNSFSR